MHTIIISLIVFSMLIFFHEFGHFIIAKINGIRVNEFSLGMGPLLFKINKNETDYSIRMLPLGGYVKMEGEDEKSDDPKAFNNKSALQRFAVIAAGPVMNFILAVVLMALIGFFAGIATTTIEVIPNQPAYNVGLKDGDVIYSINDTKVSNWDEIINLISSNPKKTVKIVVLRDGNYITYNVKPSIEPETKRGVIGIKSVTIKNSFVESIKYGFTKTAWLTKMILSGLGQIITGKSKADVVGPIGIIHYVGEAAKVGVYNVLYLAAMISVNLGLFNLFPIPALDGSRLLFICFEALRGKPIEPEKEGLIHFIGFTILMILMIFIVYKDIMRFNIF